MDIVGLEIEEDKRGDELELAKIFKIDESVDLVLTFNGVGFIGDNELFHKFKVIFGALLIDHPFHQYERIVRTKPKNIFYSMYDEGAIATAEKYINSENIFTHLMHGGSYAKNSYIKKEYDVVVIGGLDERYLNIDNVVDQYIGDELGKIAKKLYEKASKDYCKTLDEHLEGIIKDMVLPDELIKMDQFKEIIRYIYIQVDLRLRAKTRYESVLWLLKNDIQVNYFGNCENEELRKYRNFIYHGSIGYEEVLDVMAKSKIIIHDVPCFKNGSHERVFSAMLNGALVVANYNNYSYNIYQDGESIVFYDINNYQDMVDKVKYYLENEQERLRIANNALEITSKYNTWENRADEILRVYEIMRGMRNSKEEVV